MNEDTPIPLKLFTKKYEWPTLQQLRLMRHKQNTLGIAAAFVKFGGKVLIKPATFFQLVEEWGKKAQKRGATAKTDEKGVKGQVSDEVTARPL